MHDVEVHDVEVGDVEEEISFEQCWKTSQGLMRRVSRGGLAAGQLLAMKISQRTVAVAGGALFLVFALNSLISKPDL